LLKDKLTKEELTQLILMGDQAIKYFESKKENAK